MNHCSMLKLCLAASGVSNLKIGGFTDCLTSGIQLSSPILWRNLAWGVAGTDILSLVLSGNKDLAMRGIRQHMVSTYST